MRAGATASEDFKRLPKAAMILAAGSGTRLRPLTDRIPKCMIEVGGRPVLEHAINWLRRYGVDRLVINLHHQPQVLIDYFGDGARWNVQIRYSLEREAALGTAGGAKRAQAFFTQPFFVWYGDNLSTCRLDRLWELHRARNALATVALSRRDDVTQSGVAELDGAQRITRFIEKPPQLDAGLEPWVNAGIYLAEPALLEGVASDKVLDFGRDVFSVLAGRDGRLFGYRMGAEEGLWWIDTPADLARVRAQWERMEQDDSGSGTA